MEKKMKIQYWFEVTRWDDRSITNSIKYWECQRFKCHKTIELGIEGKRGSYWGNLTSFDMSRLICGLVVSYSQSKTIEVVFHLNTFGQDITEWNKASLQIELLMYRRNLLNLPMDQIPGEFRTDQKNAAIAWTFSGMQKGRKLKQEWRQMLQNLADDTELPTISYTT